VPGVQFVIFVVDRVSGSASGDEMTAVDAFNDSLRAGGHFVMAVGIGAPRAATVFDNRDGRGESRAGSLQVGDEFYSGMWIIDADSREVAERLARAASQACNRAVELRPFL
jgi:hypothetical protein